VTGAPPALVVRGLSKNFGRLEVLKAVDLSIAPGRVTGLVGPNAAGKTTLIKTILGLISPDAGEITVQGVRLDGDCRYREAIGYMPQLARFPENLTGWEVLAMLADLRAGADMDSGLVSELGLEKELAKKVRTLSGGTRQKLSAVIAFLFRPRVLILDEPTAGLDPVASGVFKDRLRAAREAGAAIVLASHTMAELEELADDIVFLLEGRIRYQGPISTLIATTGHVQLERAIASMMGAAACA
jgi:Cu-processing system ATP-binding protein